METMLDLLRNADVDDAVRDVLNEFYDFAAELVDEGLIPEERAVAWLSSTLAIATGDEMYCTTDGHVVLVAEQVVRDALNR